MTEHMHHQNGQRQSQEVRNVWGIEISTRFTFQTVVETQQQCNKDARNDDVAQAEHGKVGGIHPVDQDVLREDQFNWSIKAFGNGDHDIGAKHPEYVVHKEAGQQNQTGHHVVQVQQLDTVHGKRNTKQIVGDPVLLQQIPDTDD